MKKQNFFTHNLGSLALLLVALVLIYAAGKPQAKPARQVWLYPPDQIRHFSLGYGEVMADTFWIRLLQDFDICEQSDAPLAPQVLPFDSPTNPDGTPLELAASRCDDGWAYHLLEAITELAPRFETAYEAGGNVLSILVDDREGAYKILKKGTERFPGNSRLHYLLGFHLLYSMHDMEGAAAELTTAAKTGGQSWLLSLAGRLYSKAGQAELGIRVLESELEANPDSDYAYRYRQRLDELRKQLAEANRTHGP